MNDPIAVIDVKIADAFGMRDLPNTIVVNTKGANHMRTSRKEVEAVFKNWLLVTGLKQSKSYDDVGGYSLDYAPCYGGYDIERVCNKSGGVSMVFNNRQPAGIFVACLRAAIRTLEEMR